MHIAHRQRYGSVKMKWFKHISDSLDDPFIFDLVDRFGGDGYLVFFGVLEIYSREFKPELSWNLSVTQAYLKAKLHKRQATLIVKILKHIQNSGKWEITFDCDQITIFIPKFTTLIDDWTSKKLRSKSGHAPKNRRPDKEEDKEEDNRDIINNISTTIIDFTSQAIDSISNHMGSLAPKKTESLLKNSADTIDKLIRIDGFDLDYIKSVIEWAINDDFWKKNALSLSSLRKKSKSNDLTKFQNMANSFEQSKATRLPERTRKNIQAGEEFRRKMEKEFDDGKI